MTPERTPGAIASIARRVRTGLPMVWGGLLRSTPDALSLDPPTLPQSDAGRLLSANPDLLRRLQGGWRIVFVSIWLIYLIPTLKQAAHASNPAVATVGVVAVVAYSLLYVGVFAFIRRFRLSLAEDPRWLPARLVLLVAVGLILLTFPAAGEETLAMFVYLAVLSMFLQTARRGAVSVAVNAALVAVLSNVVPGWDPQNMLSLQILITGLAIWGILQLIVRNTQLASAREEITSLAVSQERLRFSRDLHDILGHSLTVITLKAELAGRLVRADPERAEHEIAEVERLARAALADVRATAAGYRNLTLAGELASARTALDAAGIEAHLPTALDEVPPDRLELFGWAVREGVTNVVRHSGARHCIVSVDGCSIEIVDDGAGPVSGRTGHGLGGLRERAEAVGARLSAGSADGEGFVLRVGW